MNAREAQAAAFIERELGMMVLRNGWPDFFVADPDTTRGFALELKDLGREKAKLRRTREQTLMHTALERFGIEVVVCSYDEIRELCAQPRVSKWRRQNPGRRVSDLISDAWLQRKFDQLLRFSE